MSQPAVNIPQHIAIIMDGNGRWAKKRLLPRFMGHQKGLNAVKRVVSFCAEHEVKALTLFAFSTENWKRPPEEVNKLMGLFLSALQKEVDKLHKNNVQLRIIGDKSAFDDKIQHHIDAAESLTQDNDGLVLNIAANYGGRWDIVQACQKWQQANPDLTLNDLTEADISDYICLSDLPEPDLLIRTGGEKRISNFLVWQMAYTEFYFTDALWPDVDEKVMQQAVDSFKVRERRFGKTGDQIKNIQGDA